MKLLFEIPEILYDSLIDIELRNYMLDESSVKDIPASSSALKRTSCNTTTTVMTTADWTGGFCTVCTVGANYACNVNPASFPDWNGGNRNFTDPIPAGGQISSISVEIFGVGCDGGSSPIQVSINGSSIGTNNLGGTCSCNSCFMTTVSQNYPD